ncbi:rhodanese-related sulfurtransferase [Rhodococcus sp. BP-149]|uniref:oxygen-dependent tRNA uridine(34) hydroxylase TrhO n=1 Tax=unclassified Rhodococcus (in: high G+C Gram-positive bacteria) TaxID=192944 RepID=UPI001C9AF8C4|nr:MULTISPECIES: rhodanese-related sulfurtransferase [unclassified Rhodococcus (in: high G+C Gram-positive bacteria)]MBY6685207.1 rhodanese-related sulfurtransferase [Rhodococcus sp. BP-288]MBY6696343.1 rhodanese-related sulfurtransferase [Rhodococcus sp. BP-188]MBY6698207.1 rhodanese-related sulfurtransferase [Rhodococcus sp. BP-285]MBY6705137.1 rhodanese-related sulfurtransferase [Rhodococcus sp. BP-283]MBY6713076.1 rhodanese-related sulfurtransferase [Rhodococcus sp. BP-160]
MSTPKIVLFYVFTPLPDPEAVRLWQHTLASAHGLTGRIIVSPHGINATVGGDVRAVKKYVRGTREYAPFAAADVKWSDGRGDDFPKLSVRVRPEIVTFGVPDELHVTADGVVGGGRHLAPEEVHDLVAERGDDVVFLDGRNAFEAAIGRFDGAVVPDVENTREFLAQLDSGVFDHLKSKPVVTYCTGGVRCEVLSSLMRSRGFEEVYQLDGGIVRYGERYGDDGLWSGSLYVFDQRGTVSFSDHPAVIGTCSRCSVPTSRYLDTDDGHGRGLALVCTECVPT